MSDCNNTGGTWVNASSIQEYVDQRNLTKIIVEAFTGADNVRDGAMGLVPAPLATQQNYYLRGDGTWQPFPPYALSVITDNGDGTFTHDDGYGTVLTIDMTNDVMTGATAGADGKKGLVPQSVAGQEDLLLHGDGIWRTPAIYKGATAGVAGTAGSVPPAAAGQQDRYLRGDGTWGVPTVSGTTVTAASGVRYAFQANDWTGAPGAYQLVIDTALQGMSMPGSVTVWDAANEQIAMQVTRAGAQVTLSSFSQFAGEAIIFEAPTTLVTL